MYGQFQNPIASAAKWTFFGFIIVILMGFLLGGNIKDAKWINSNIADAEAERIRIDSAHRQATNEIEERRIAAQTDAEIRQIEREQKLLDAQYEHDIQAIYQDLAHRELAFRTWMTALTILTSAFALLLFVSAIIWAGSRAWVYIQSNSQKEQTMAKATSPATKWITNLPEREPYDPWNDPAYRRQQRVAAQNQEQKEREEARILADRMKGIAKSGRANTSEYNNLPLAGD